ncbi:MAG: DUF3793 family protein [Bacillota bacterium]|nr:DUF3793 family protein [Bacillota bacterium]
MLEKCLIDYCAPTLASIKTANLFNYKIPLYENIDSLTAAWNQKLNSKGVAIAVLRNNGDRALLYVYRPERLKADLERREAFALLRQYGYKSYSIPYAIERLRQRLAASGEFPHEIGLFLGYPLGDVVGFIENRGKCCKCCGCWKVYDDVEEAQRLFREFRRCRDDYAAEFCRGKSVLQLTVAV